MVKADACNTGDVSLIPRSGRSPAGVHGNPFQNSCLENPMDIGSQRVGHDEVTTGTHVVLEA